MLIYLTSDIPLAMLTFKAPLITGQEDKMKKYPPLSEHTKALRMTDAIESETGVHNFSGLLWILKQDIHAGPMSTPWMVARVNPSNKRRFLRGVLRDTVYGRPNSYATLQSPLTEQEKQDILDWIKRESVAEGGAK